MWKKMAIRMGKEYVFLILDVWASEQKVLGSKDVRNVKKGVQVLLEVLVKTNNTTLTGEEVAEFLEKL